MAHTYAILDVSPAAFTEVKQKLAAAEYHHAFDRDVIDMHGIALRAAPDAPTAAVGRTATFNGHAIPREGLDIDTAAMRLAWHFLQRRVGDGVLCATCGCREGDDHEPTDECGIVANLLHEMRTLVAARFERRARARRRG